MKFCIGSNRAVLSIKYSIFIYTLRIINSNPPSPPRKVCTFYFSWQPAFSWGIWYITVSSIIITRVLCSFPPRIKLIWYSNLRPRHYLQLLNLLINQCAIIRFCLFLSSIKVLMHTCLFTVIFGTDMFKPTFFVNCRPFLFGVNPHLEHLYHVPYFSSTEEQHFWFKT